MSFDAFQLHPKLLQAIDSVGFEEPTPIQLDTIPAAMQGHDILACAETGSGKTAAFLLPILHRLLEQQRRHTRALVLTPTRELAAQVADHLREFAQFTELAAATIYGGVPVRPQVEAFRRGVDVVVATPGRLLDHLHQDYARLDHVEYLVLDEVDRMLDMGFIADVEAILALLPAERQTFFLSATIPEPVAELSQQLLEAPVMIDVDRPSSPATGVRQAVYPVPEDLKRALLLEMLGPPEIRNVLVFARTKHRANRLAGFLRQRGVSADRIHGNRTQAQRSAALRAFVEGRTRVLVATNVAARGLDIEALSHVINYDVPDVPDDYVHRVGRTARAQRTGDALTFVAPHEEIDLLAIEHQLGRELPRLYLEDFDYNAKVEDRLEPPVPERVAAMRARRRARDAQPQGRTPGEGPNGDRARREPGSGPERSRKRRRGKPSRRAAEVNGNVEGAHQQSHVELLNQRSQRRRNGSRPRQRRRRDSDGNLARKPAERRGEANGNVQSDGQTEGNGFVDDERQPLIPADHDLPPRDSHNRRPSHQPAALSRSGRRYQVKGEE